MAIKKAFPEWKKIVIEALRTFVLAFLAVASVQIQAGVDFKEWKVWLVNLVIAGSSAGVKALSRWLRDKIGKGDYSNWIYKVSL